MDAEGGRGPLLPAQPVHHGPAERPAFQHLLLLAGPAGPLLRGVTGSDAPGRSHRLRRAAAGADLPVRRLLHREPDRAPRHLLARGALRRIWLGAHVGLVWRDGETADGFLAA